MRKLGLLALIALGLALLVDVARAQSRDDVFTAAGVSVSTAVLDPLPDGGCAVRWCGTATSADAGATLQGCTDDVELRNATNQTRCAALVSAGLPRVQRALRFPVDAGAP